MRLSHAPNLETRAECSVQSKIIGPTLTHSPGFTLCESQSLHPRTHTQHTQKIEWEFEQKIIFTFRVLFCVNSLRQQSASNQARLGKYMKNERSLHWAESERLSFSYCYFFSARHVTCDSFVMLNQLRLSPFLHLYNRDGQSQKNGHPKTVIFNYTASCHSQCSFFNHFCTVRNVFVNVAGLTHLVMLCLEKNYSKLYGSKQSGMEWYSNPSCIKDVHSSAWTFCCMDLLPLIS